MEGRGINDIAVREAWTRSWRIPSGRWPAIRWGLAIILPIAVVLWGISLLLAPGEPDTLTIRVMSQVTGEGIEGADVLVRETRYITDPEGEILIDPIDPGTSLAVSALGYESSQTVVTKDDRQDLTIYLNGVLVMGALTDAVSGEPIVGAQVTALDADGQAFSSTGSDASGGFVFKSIPEDASFQVVDPLYGDSVHPIGGLRSLPIRLDPPPVSGRVVDVTGQPIEGARVSAPTSHAISDEEGIFSLDPVGQGSDVEVSADGYDTRTVLIEGTVLGDVVLPVLAIPSPSPGGGS